jgi:Superinfection immunity protein
MSSQAWTLIGLLVAVYLLPTIVAILRRKADTISILIINVGLGWTVLFWVLALARAFEPKRHRWSA